LTHTRLSWHRVAEHVLAAGQFATRGTIRLRPTAGGISTTVGRQLAVVGDQLRVEDPDGALRTVRLTTLGAAADAAGVELGLRGSYTPATDPDPSAALPVDPDAARLLADWYALGDAALRRGSLAWGAAQEPVLWPEHLDVAVTVDAVTYGCSPGDDSIPAPYLYVVPHAGPPDDDPFWDTAFGAARTHDRVGGVDDALAFLTEGRDRTARTGAGTGAGRSTT
jgi:hypothetical protein